MTRIFLQGGLGNQLFQYAAGVYLKSRGLAVSFVTSLIDNPPPGTTKRTVGIADLISDSTGVMRIPRYNDLWLPIGARLGLGVNETSGHDWELLKTRKMFPTGVKGYFQDPRLVELVWEDLKGEFFKHARWKNLVSEPNEDRICVHIRRGDYKHLSNHGVLGVEYYERCFRAASSSAPIDSKIIVISDAPEEALDLLRKVEVVKNRELTVDESNSEWGDFSALSTSRFVITANSSFSWWGATIAASKGAQVFGPSPWFRSEVSVLDTSDWTSVPSTFEF